MLTFFFANTINIKVHDAVRKLIDEGENKILIPASLAQFVWRRLDRWIENAYAAKHQLEEGNQYSILERGRKTGEAVINDLQTGVEQMNTQWSDGLQQFIQLKHTNKLTEESLKAIFMSNYIFFKQYGGKVYGMTGTLGERLERDLLGQAYDLTFFELPRFMKERNVRYEDVLVATRAQWIEKIERDVALVTSRGVQRGQAGEEEAEASLDRIRLIEEELAVKNSLVSDLKESLAAEAKNSQTTTADVTKLKEELASAENARDAAQFRLEDAQDELGLDGRAKGARALLIICENKNDVGDIVRALLVRHKHLFDYNGKVDGLRQIKDARSRKVSTQIKQVRPDDIIVATNVAGRGTDFKLSKVNIILFLYREETSFFPGF